AAVDLSQESKPSSFSRLIISDALLLARIGFPPGYDDLSIIPSRRATAPSELRIPNPPSAWRAFTCPPDAPRMPLKCFIDRPGGWWQVQVRAEPDPSAIRFTG
ncbi:MAG: hypothetical protein ABIY70_27020, partial [Capsulimonas sp.]|uniref:hypothetical protein n=1 Tax=Capsulimonas sp. TaxID=2494211 RepID=UPI003264E1E5